MRDKLKLVVAIVVVILLFALTRACSNYFMDRIREDINDETKVTISNELKSEYAKDWISSICDFLKGNIIYEDFPLSDNFRKKYKTVNDIIKGKVMGTIEANSEIFDINEDYNKHIMGIGVKTGNGFEEIIYQLHYIINENNELDDIEILDSRVYEDENGSYPKYVSYKTYIDSPYTALYCLTNPSHHWYDGDVCYLTDNYISNHKNYKIESILPWENWLYIDEGAVKQDEGNDRIWYVEAVNTEEVRRYKIEFIIDEKGYVDDYILEEIERREVFDKESVENEYHDFYS